MSVVAGDLFLFTVPVFIVVLLVAGWVVVVGIQYSSLVELVINR